MPTRPARIVFTTWGSLGDLHPYLALAIELRRRGHEAVVATLPVWRENVERTGVEFRPLRPDVAPDDPAARDVVRKILDARGGPAYLFDRILGPALRETYEDTVAAVAGERPADLVVSHFYETSIAAVQRLGRRALLLVGEGAAARRATLPDTIGLFDYAPHSVVMPRAAVIVHQGGIGTTAQALRAGRPMLVAPFGQDQPDNARRVVELGVGRTITRTGVTVDRLTRAVGAASYSTVASAFRRKGCHRGLCTAPGDCRGASPCRARHRDGLRRD